MALRSSGLAPLFTKSRAAQWVTLCSERCSMDICRNYPKIWWEIRSCVSLIQPSRSDRRKIYTSRISPLVVWRSFEHPAVKLVEDMMLMRQMHWFWVSIIPQSQSKNIPEAYILSIPRNDARWRLQPMMEGQERLSQKIFPNPWTCVMGHSVLAVQWDSMIDFANNGLIMISASIETGFFADYFVVGRYTCHWGKIAMQSSTLYLSQPCFLIMNRVSNFIPHRPPNS